MTYKRLIKMAVELENEAVRYEQMGRSLNADHTKEEKAEFRLIAESYWAASEKVRLLKVV